jgi:hypothetical protein
MREENSGKKYLRRGMEKEEVKSGKMRRSLTGLSIQLGK